MLSPRAWSRPQAGCLIREIRPSRRRRPCQKSWIKIPPDLVVEVVSPNDTVYELEEKLADYQKVEVALIWVVYPNSRTVLVYRADGSTSFLREDEELSGEDIIPGFRCSVREIFPPNEPSAEVQPAPAVPNGHSYLIVSIPPVTQPTWVSGQTTDKPPAAPGSSIVWT